MSSSIERLVINGESRRRFFLTAEVTFSDRGEDDYYGDSELPDLVADWMSNALEDRDDSPRVWFEDAPAASEGLPGFLAELAALTRKYGLEVGGCGDCGSPWVNRMEDDAELLEHLTYCTVHGVYGAYDEHGRCE